MTKVKYNTGFKKFQRGTELYLWGSRLLDGLSDSGCCVSSLEDDIVGEDRHLSHRDLMGREDRGPSALQRAQAF